MPSSDTKTFCSVGFGNPADALGEVFVGGGCYPGEIESFGTIGPQVGQVGGQVLDVAREIRTGRLHDEIR